MKNYFILNNADILTAVDRFCSYYKEMNLLADSGRIQSSLDRGAFVRPQDVLNEAAWDLLGQKRNSLSYAYGPEAGEDYIRELIARVENAKWNTEYSSENILITAGAWSGVNLVIEEACGFRQGICRNPKIAVIGPTHLQLFHRAINILGVEVSSYNFCMASRPHLPLAISDFDEVFSSQPAMLFVTNPTNPDGLYYSAELIEELIMACEKRGIYLVLDEIQDFLTSHDSKGLNYGSWIQKPHVVRIDSYSKKRGLADYRVGWVIASKEFLGSRTSGMIGRLSGLMGNAPRSANSAIAYLLQSELDRIAGAEDVLINNWEILRNKEKLVLEHLSTIPQIKEIVPRQACISCVVRVEYPGEDLALASDLMHAGTLIMPCGGYGFLPKDNFLRITFAEREEKIIHSMTVLREVLNGFREVSNQKNSTYIESSIP